jgi:exoribonuclease R
MIELCNLNERKAMDAERSLKTIKILKYIDSLGKDRLHSGVLSNIEDEYCAVELIDYFVYGRLHYIDVKGRCKINVKAQEFQAHSLGKTFGLGDEVNVKIKQIDPYKGRIDFVMVV